MPWFSAQRGYPQLPRLQVIQLWEEDTVSPSKHHSTALTINTRRVLLFCCHDTLAVCVFAAGDELFRVVERQELTPSPSGCRRVQVTNQAAIRVLAWKLWSKSNVIYEIQTADRQATRGQQTDTQEERVTFELASSVSEPWPSSVYVDADSKQFGCRNGPCSAVTTERN